MSSTECQGDLQLTHQTLPMCKHLIDKTTSASWQGRRGCAGTKLRGSAADFWPQVSRLQTVKFTLNSSDKPSWLSQTLYERRVVRSRPSVAPRSRTTPQSYLRIRLWWSWTAVSAAAYCAGAERFVVPESRPAPSELKDDSFVLPVIHTQHRSVGVWEM